MKRYRSRLKDAFLANPAQMAIIWCGLRYSETWRRCQRFAPYHCERLLENEEPEEFIKECDKATRCLGSALKFASTQPLRRWPIIGDTCRRLLAQIDWNAIATRIMNNAWCDIYLAMEQSKEE